MKNGFNHFASADVEMIGFGLTFRKLDRLKREIAVAVWNWETRRGLPHYDGGLRAVIEAGQREAAARRSSKANVTDCDTRRKVEG